MMLPSVAEHAIESNRQQAVQCPRGGIGRRAWFRSMCRKVWGFESLRGHQNQKGWLRKHPSFFILMPTSEAPARRAGGTRKPCPAGQGGVAERDRAPSVPLKKSED